MSRFSVSLGLIAMVFVSGCSSDSSSTTSSTAPTANTSKYFLSEEPASPQSVIAAKKDSKDGDEVTLVGRIGGSESPFVSGRAAFTLVDTSLVPCNERSGDSCETPWDYCCDTDTLPGATAVVKLVEGDDQTVSLDAKSGLGLKELQTVVVRGKAKRDEAGNLTVLAPAVFVKK